jgi:hypothetical protein
MVVVVEQEYIKREGEEAFSLSGEAPISSLLKLSVKRRGVARFLTSQ